MLIRVRSNVGVWRVDGLNEATATVADVRRGIAQTRPNVVYTSDGFSSDPAGQKLITEDDGVTLQSQGLARHGQMIYCRVEPSTCVEVTAAVASGGTSNATETPPAAAGTGTTMRRVIDKDGQIRLVPASESDNPNNSKGFRKGMMALRDMKMSWTLADFVALDSQFEFKIQRQETAVCQQVSLDVASVNHFQVYCQRFQFQRKRMAYLYGTFVDADDDAEKDDSKKDESSRKKAVVEAIYEPPQEVDPTAAEGFVLLDDDREEQVQQIAEWLGLRKVGWIVCHEPRPKGFVLNSAEVLMAAEFQLEAAEGVNETPFVTVKVAPDAKTGQVSVEAFQVSQQCMAMVAEEALEVDAENPQSCKVNETFTAIQEGKPSPTVENNFFLTVVPIVQHTSDRFVADFPKLNRDLDDRVPSTEALKQELRKAGTQGWTLEDRLADLNLLVYIAPFLSEQDVPRICQSLRDKTPIEEGYKLIIKSLAGLEGSY